MRLVEIRLPHEDDKSFIFYHENSPFADWHYHPEYELVLIVKGRGKRSIGDSLGRFEPGDLVLMGPYVPHEYVCDAACFEDGEMQSECIVIQFDQGFLGKQFFQLPETRSLLKVLSDSNYGCKFIARTAVTISEIMLGMVAMNETDRLYSLFSIFQVLSKTTEYELIATPLFVRYFQSVEDESMDNVIQYLHKNFRNDVRVSKLLEIAHMSNSSFCTKFKRTFRMPFQDYLIKIRIAYACRLMIENTKSISEIASQAGFLNISNFNRQFRRVKNTTPSDFIAYKQSQE